MFAMGSLIFQMEHGAKPQISTDSHGTLILPEIRTGHQILDTIIRKAWLGHYGHTSEMLEHFNCIDPNGVSHSQSIHVSFGSLESLRHRIGKWRECRHNEFGKSYPL